MLSLRFHVGHESVREAAVVDGAICCSGLYHCWRGWIVSWQEGKRIKKVEGVAPAVVQGDKDEERVIGGRVGERNLGGGGGVGFEEVKTYI